MTQEAFEKAKELVARKENYRRLLTVAKDARECCSARIFVQYGRYESSEHLAFTKDMRDRVLAMAEGYYLDQIEKLDAELAAL